ncbi:septum site-determining protein MinC [Ferruginivarius sediminum]|uniref:Probable septum site-determining protein MinC n=1 Tax=Ferruginivarius sediminum TaxID=2661937 RepID=A0A369TB07_9PROT|nr:septum site-determining protein MinC [Ferruginivarius sediminum]RDD61367.1 septum site-determining protein MinC [Ferruginivarius sediminum]
MHESSTKTADAPARLRGGTFTMMIVDIPAEGDPLAGVETKLRQAPSFFDGAPVVLDLLAVADDARVDLIDIVARLREMGLIPIGVQNGGDRQNATALAAGLCPFPIWRSGRQRPERESDSNGEHDDQELAEPQPASGAKSQDGQREATAPPKRDGTPALLVTRPVRSGKRLYARDGDLVAAAPVSAGAELIADGHIHVYGPLRGRALAGVRGDETARIFCQSLEAELVSIAGAYRVREDIDEALIGKPVQIFLKGEQLVIDPLVRTPK